MKKANNSNQLLNIKTLGELKAAGYRSKSVRDELRDNLIVRLKEKLPVFAGIVGYESTVIPEIERAILSRHSINLLGLRGQAKTRIARSMVDLLDEYIPVVQGSELNDDPLKPVSLRSQDLIKSLGDETPIAWLHRNDRYIEKLATPDVTVADLIGDVDPIKAANLKLDYSDQRVIHFGLVPRSNRCIFVINELPDLQPRIQVSLFNILQEGDIQIRGFMLRLPLDIQFVFTANPEDYTNRGAIITPLKDRIQSQILTHYPLSIDQASAITKQEVKLSDDQRKKIIVPDLVADLLEQIAFEARESEFIDQKSGVSARMSITAYENLLSTIERRMILNAESSGQARISDLMGVVPAIIGKIELVYEGEQEGPRNVALHLISQCIRKKFPQIFPDPEFIKRKKAENPYQGIITWFNSKEMELGIDETERDYKAKLEEIKGLAELVKKYNPGLDPSLKTLYMEFVLHGCSEYSLISKHVVGASFAFTDLLNSLFSAEEEEN